MLQIVQLIKKIRSRLSSARASSSSWYVERGRAALATQSFQLSLQMATLAFWARFMIGGIAACSLWFVWSIF